MHMSSMPSLTPALPGHPYFSIAHTQISTHLYYSELATTTPVGTVSLVLTAITHTHYCTIWENPACSNFYEYLVSYIFHRANLPPSFRPSACFVQELEHFVYDRAIPPIIEKLQFKGIALHTYGIFTFYLCVNRKSIKWPWVGPLK